MKRFLLTIGFLLLLVGAVCPQERTETPSMDSLLREILLKDQGIRLRLNEFLRTMDQDSLLSISRQMHLIDSVNQRIVAEILEDGWPDQLSDSANLAIFLVIDHAGQEIQKKYIDAVEAAAEAGKIPMSDWATLTDRMLMRENREQRYGTQTKMFLSFPHESRTLCLWPVEEPENLDARRKEVGLPPIEEYLNIMEAHTGQKIVWEKELSVEEFHQKYTP